MENTISMWHAQEARNFQTISDLSIRKIEEALLMAVQEYLRRKLKEDGVASLSMPWGTYHAEVRKGPGGGNISVELTPTDDFIDEIKKPIKGIFYPEYDHLFSRLFNDFVAYGVFDANTEEAKKKIEQKGERGVLLLETQRAYFPIGYAYMIANFAHEKMQDLDVATLQVGETVDHGIMEFTYTEKGGEYNVDIKFVPSKSFKQYLKSDGASDTDSTEVALEDGVA